jgi:hypothetical protein
MADHLTMLPVDGSEQAQRIMDRFEQRTGLRAEPSGEGRIYHLGSEEHEVDVVETLNAIDASWPEHLGLQDLA